MQVLRQADAVLLSEVFAAGEAAISGADGRALAKALGAVSHTEPLFVEEIAQMPKAIHNFVRNDDVVVLMGAGSISRVATQLKELA